MLDRRDSEVRGLACFTSMPSKRRPRNWSPRPCWERVGSSPVQSFARCGSTRRGYHAQSRLSRHWSDSQSEIDEQVTQYMAGRVPPTRGSCEPVTIVQPASVSTTMIIRRRTLRAIRTIRNFCARAAIFGMRLPRWAAIRTGGCAELEATPEIRALRAPRCRGPRLHSRRGARRRRIAREVMDAEGRGMARLLQRRGAPLFELDCFGGVLRAHVFTDDGRCPSA